MRRRSLIRPAGVHEAVVRRSARGWGGKNRPTLGAVEEYSVDHGLVELCRELFTGTHRPVRVRWAKIDKA